MPLSRPYRVVVLALVGALAVIATACEVVPNPSATQVIPASWGADIQPRHADVLYVPGGLRGCPGYLTSNEPCMGAQTLDIYPATLGGNRGTVVFIHGGGFVFGSKYPIGGMGILKRLTHLGWNVVSIDYRLAKDGRYLFPASIQDTAAALRWVRANGSAYGLNTAKLVTVGHSAGGTLAALAGTAANSGRSEYAGIPPLSGWVSIAGIMDHTAGNAGNYWTELWTGNAASRGALAMPVTWWDASDPKGLIAHGDQDTFVEYENANRMAARAGGSDRLLIDTVDVFDNNAPMPSNWREHQPAPGMNSPNLESWLAGLPTVDSSANPFGSLDVVSVVPGAPRVSVGGWSIDPDSTKPTAIHVYAGSRFIGALSANQTRTDVAAAYPLYGLSHGFGGEMAAPSGNQQICAYAINVGPGTSNSSLGCKNVAVSGFSPIGNVDVVRAAGATSARIRGWALDFDTSGPLAVHVYANGQFVGATATSVLRPDVVAAYPGYSTTPGYDTTVSVTAGRNEVCAYAINVGGGAGNPLLGCRTITV